jgi:single-stranded DNA-binding protein
MLMTDKTSWFRITAFNPSEYVKEHVKKGTLVFVDGEVSLDRYNDEASGKTLTAVRVVQSMFLIFASGRLLILDRVHFLRGPRPQTDSTENEAEAEG